MTQVRNQLVTATGEVYRQRLSVRGFFPRAVDEPVVFDDSSHLSGHLSWFDVAYHIGLRHNRSQGVQRVEKPF